ncbi:MAG: hypothetical protein Ctma_1522 [Catillopecten margaritatus gill symbiont]|uniref:Type II toxin-antitoxin system PemK/MazF family toxin n=1 Tax=Catillopecten margaritatus gill symbiont TaxID=3083288 RepID=A0AAU6PIE4_9GAMM
MGLNIEKFDIVLCKFYFTDLKSYKNRPVLILKDNLPFDDFLVIAISSKVNKLFDDEILIDNHAFKNGEIPKTSKVMLRKTFVIEKSMIVKKYGKLTDTAMDEIHESLCNFYQC